MTLGMMYSVPPFRFKRNPLAAGLFSFLVFVFFFFLFDGLS